jgi:HEAT repeat protein
VGEARVVESLAVVLKDEHPSVRAVVPGVLERLDPNWERSEAARQALPRLKAALNDDDYWVRQAAAKAMQRITEMQPAEPDLEGFADPEDHKRRSAAETFLDLLGDEDRDLRQAAVEALGRIGDHRAPPLLAQSLQDPDLWVRVAAAQALKHLGWKPANESQSAVLAGLLKTPIP